MPQVALGGESRGDLRDSGGSKYAPRNMAVCPLGSWLQPTRAHPADRDKCWSSRGGASAHRFDIFTCWVHMLAYRGDEIPWPAIRLCLNRHGLRLYDITMSQGSLKFTTQRLARELKHATLHDSSKAAAAEWTNGAAYKQQWAVRGTWHSISFCGACYCDPCSHQRGDATTPIKYQLCACNPCMRGRYRNSLNSVSDPGSCMSPCNIIIY